MTTERKRQNMVKGGRKQKAAERGRQRVAEGGKGSKLQKTGGC
jgi:hypothetical protein